jgi:acyl-CoA synthetase (AMP-forming)/AMP-acid ligase II
MDDQRPGQAQRNLIQRVNVGDSLTRSAAARPAQLAVRDGERRWTYAELNAWVNRLAHGLSALGYRRGDALGIASGNSAEFLAFYYACAKTGVVAVPVNLGWRADEVAYVPDALIRRCMAEFGCDFALMFGQTEMSPCTTLFRPEHQLSHIGAVGTPLTGVQVAIMGPDGGLLPPGSRARSSTAGRPRWRST